MFSSETDLQRADHNRDLRKHDWRPGDRAISGDPLTVAQLTAVAKLIGHTEGLVSSGILGGGGLEVKARTIVAEALAAFGLPSQAELLGADRFPGNGMHGG